MIGVLGGMSWESSLDWYRMANEKVRDELGGFHSAPILLDSLDFAEIEAMQARLAQNRAQLLATIADIENKPAGMQCTENAQRMLAKMHERR